jgi:uncharacterized DUF497 family protein
MTKKVAWMPEDETSNLLRYDLNFTLAKQVVLNPLTVALVNVHRDFSYIGFCDDLSTLAYVYCIREEEFTRIVLARRASRTEQVEFFRIIRGAK